MGDDDARHGREQAKHARPDLGIARPGLERVGSVAPDPAIDVRLVVGGRQRLPGRRLHAKGRDLPLDPVGHGSPVLGACHLVIAITSSAVDQSPVSRKAWLYTDLAHASKTAPNASASPARARARNCAVGSSTLGNWLGLPWGSSDPRHI